MGEVKEAWSRLVKVLSKAARNRRVGGRGPRFRAEVYAERLSNFLSPPRGSINSHPPGYNTPLSCIVKTIRIKRSNDNGADKSFITPLSPFNKNFLFSFLHCSPLLFSFFFRQAKVFLTSLERREVASVSPELSPRRVNTNGDPLRY